MPHQCVRCSKFYEDGAQEILKGCPCGARLFFFIKKEKLEQAQKTIEQNLKPEQKQQIEQDVLNLVGAEKSSDPVVLDFESVRVLEPGKYELDLVKLFRVAPLIFKLDEGKYIIDVAETFNRLKKK
jgi:predicted  nucleic acid-binding Zn-ribbon protein